MDSIDINKNVQETMRKHWGSSVVFTDNWITTKKLNEHMSEIDMNARCWHRGIYDHEVSETELLQGELEAVTVKVGCYTVRSAQRVYKVWEPGYVPEEELPADKTELEPIKKELDKYAKIQSGTITVGIATTGFLLSEWRNKFRITHEISVRHNDSPDNDFTYICRAAHSRNYSWYEHIACICTAKENSFIPDEYASLLVLNNYTGDSFSFDTWYKLEPTGKITTLRLHPFDSNMNEAQFQ